MGRCINHPEAETHYHCMKHNIYLCRDCLACRDPKLYCKFRSACPIHFVSRRGFEETLPSEGAADTESDNGKTAAGPECPGSPGPGSCPASGFSGVNIHQPQ